MRRRYNLRQISRFIGDFVDCGRLMINPRLTYGYLRSGMQPDVGNFRKGPLRFQGRKEDWIAIKEVLVQDEYYCIESILDRRLSPRVIDLGANIGSFAIRVFLHCPNAEVASVEAAEDTFKLLECNQRSNPLLHWKLFKNGIWRHNEQISLKRRGISVGHRVIEDGGDDTVQGITLAALLDVLDWASVDLIKMDIEGGEEAVVPTAVEVFKKTRYLIIEIHTDRIDQNPVMDVLRSLFSHHWQLNERTSSKPLLIMTNEKPLHLPRAWRVWP